MSLDSKKALTFIFNGLKKSGLRFAAINQENKQVIAIDYQNEERKQIKGNVYVAKVVRIESSLQAAFIEFGANKQGFLSISEIQKHFYILSESIENRNKKSFLRFSDVSNTSKIVGVPDYYSIQNALLSFEATKKPNIKELIANNMVIIVQAIKEERGNKCAAFTTKVQLKGCNVVYCPNSARNHKVESKMHSGENIEHINAIIRNVDLDDKASLVINPHQENICIESIIRESSRIIDRWNECIKSIDIASIAPGVLCIENELVERVFRKFNPEVVGKIIADDRTTFDFIIESLRNFNPMMIQRVSLNASKISAFERLNIESVFDSLFSRTVALNSGGYLVIDITEACIVIDVNSGKMTKNTEDIESTARKTNIEAARKIAEHIKLRNLSGIIVIDFIDMLDYKNQIAVENYLKKCFLDDPSNITIGKIGDFGLLQISRQRLGLSLNEISSVVCDKCNGFGYNRLPIFCAEELINELGKMANNNKLNEFNITIAKRVFDFILKNYFDEWHRMASRLSKRLTYEIKEEIPNNSGFIVNIVSINTEEDNLFSRHPDCFNQNIFEDFLLESAKNIFFS